MSQLIVERAAVEPERPPGLLAVARTNEWWVGKFAPVLATFYATASLGQRPLLPLLGHLGLLLLALLVGAIYVSVLNDWTDLRADAAAGKANRLAGRSPGFIGLVLGSCVLGGIGFGRYFWQLSPTSGLLYLGAWVVYSLYSLPPARLKERGFAGVLADASGAHVFPQLLTVAAVGQWTGQAVPTLWWLAIGAWALACGIHNILWHQLSDAEADAQAQLDTFVCRRGVRFAQRLGHLVVFPVEVIAFGLVLAINYNAWALGLLLVYAGLEWCRLHVYGHRPTVLHSHRRIVLSDYYQFFYPLALLASQCGRYPTDGVVLGLHLLLFSSYAWQFAQEGRVYLLVLGRKLSAGRL
ncbi:hypothetical protein FNT36_05395 [Hymenobacter setariae]|uniref:Prenyltransferase n=1 Tax=Hymenobacter setariae TaxID=2594794 RepID=A0A558C4F6_9BACT|nr:UbiA family prenyltransferase [Hymenobacter setariae]TVT43522.1 hypothetical protein FNT36_05395 [Hymenobacter setariae]